MNINLNNEDIDIMKTNFARIASYFYKGVTVNDALREAIMNSIQANATNICIDFQFAYEKTLDGEVSNLGNLNKLIIEDNGDGLTRQNIDAFLEVATEHKRNIGGKGLGRISFLNLASTVKVESVSNEKKSVEFDFTFKTDENDIKISNCNDEQHSYTKIYLSDLNLKHPKTQVVSCVNFVKEKFNLMLFLKQQETQKKISIKFLVNGRLFDEVRSNDICCFKTINHINNNCEFLIYAFKNKEKQGVRIYYCANNIQVKPVVITETFHTEYVFAITSTFFDEKANAERTQIDFQSNDKLAQVDMLLATPNNNFEKELKDICLDVIHNCEPNIKEDNQKRLGKLEEKYGYINFNDIDVNSLEFNEKNIIDSYRNRINQKEDRLAMLLDKPDISADELVCEVIEQNKHELAKYIFHRDLVAKKGLSLTNSNENEDVLHNLFFPQKTSVVVDDKTENNKNHLYQSCVWLLDDKFMSYTYTASDITIKKINTEIGSNDFDCTSEKRPDLFILYNSPEESELLKDVVLIEFKKGNIDYKEKTSAIDQVDEYKEKLKKIVSNINNFYCYIICDFKADDVDIERVMTNRAFTKVFSNNGCMYYGYLPGSKTHVTFVSSNSIFADAVARNKTFLNILKGKNNN